METVLHELETYAKIYTQTIFGHLDRITVKHGPKIGYVFCMRALDELISLQVDVEDIPEVKSTISTAIESLAVRSSDLFVQVCDNEASSGEYELRLH